VKVFLAATSLQPDYGGPAFSVSRLATALADVGVDVGLWASDGSAVVSPLLPKRTSVRRIAGSESEALEWLERVDLLHDNGIWLPHNHRLAVLAEKRGIPRVVSIRGMLEPWAFRHKQAKKKVAWWLYQRHDLKKAQLHIATSEAEANNLQSLGLKVPVALVPNGIDLPEERPRNPGLESQTAVRSRVRTALFLGRIYPVKGLPMLIEAWARVRPEGWVLRIAGPDEAGHQKQVERAVSDAGLSSVVSFIGPVEPQMKSSLFFDTDLFVLPTHSESFGMAVAEALAHAVPVLTTTGAPWSRVPEIGCGWWVQPTVDGIAEGLRHATSLDRETLLRMGENGRSLVSKEFGWKVIANRMLSRYEEVMQHGSRGHERTNLQPALPTK
jgi:glycosyltransferase involved in cell wall biosynthesis